MQNRDDEDESTDKKKKYDEEEYDEMEHIPSSSGKVPPPPPSGPVSPPPSEQAVTYVSKWQDLPSNGNWDSRPDGTWYTETITDVDKQTASNLDDFLTEYYEDKEDI